MMSKEPSTNIVNIMTQLQYGKRFLGHHYYLFLKKYMYMYMYMYINFTFLTPNFSKFEVGGHEIYNVSSLHPTAAI